MSASTLGEHALNHAIMPTGHPSGGLVRQVTARLREEITSGRFAPGDKLPSQALLSEQFEVSRSVLREAVAGLQADGLLEARQGAGVFVTNQLRAPAMPLLQSVDAARVSSILEILELRSAVEVEAAGLAAVRRSPLQEEAILHAHNKVASLIAAGHRSTDADFEFHRSIAAATNNPRFVELLDVLGSNTIPDIMRHGHLDMILEEHRAILLAISASDEDAARQAMRIHIRASQQRYRFLIHKLDE
jgi:GntR family transcriptional repressor for pyruvate dehydrogenase complex